ncbi:MAG TPA: OB-fold nucleic acid binding domain-containing protein [Natronosporangium sp.]|nr:OB-fold nucleic acid binding domain-containing protein [Natronosporangium sp.]
MAAGGAAGTRRGDHETPLRRLVRRLTQTEEQRDAELLRREATRAGYRLARDCTRGQFVTLAGRLRTVTYSPRTQQPALEAELYDGTGSVTLVWLGRRSIVGIEPGRRITVRGRVAERDGQLVIFNPYYELSP